MYQTIQMSSCVFVQGEFVEALCDGRVVIRVGARQYRGHPIARHAFASPADPEPCAALAAKAAS